MMHISMSIRYDDAVFQKEMASSWREGTLYFYSRWYNYDEHSEAEWALLNGWRAQLLASMPEELRTGVHLLAKARAFMGEDIFVVDGALQHTVHCQCAACGEYQMVSRDQRTWCVPCNGYQEASFDPSE